LEVYRYCHEPENAVITKKEDNQYYFRSYDRGYNTPGHTATVGVTGFNTRLIIEDNQELNVGDFVEIHYFENPGHIFGFTCKKKTPTEKDIELNNNYQRYLDAVAKNSGLFLKDVLTFGKEKIENTEDKYNILLSDEEINNLIEKYIYSIKVYGIAGGIGRGMFGISLQLKENNLFDKERCDYDKLLGIDIDPFFKRILPSPLPEEYSSKIEISASAGAYNPNYKNDRVHFIFEYGDRMFRIDSSKSGLSIVPYVEGSFQEEMAKLENNKNK